MAPKFKMVSVTVSASGELKLIADDLSEWEVAAVLNQAAKLDEWQLDEWLADQWEAEHPADD